LPPIQRQPLALDDLMERHFGCDGVANSQVGLAVANGRGWKFTIGCLSQGRLASRQPHAKSNFSSGSRCQMKAKRSKTQRLCAMASWGFSERAAEF
jgi:hypothetical protein